MRPISIPSDGYSIGASDQAAVRARVHSPHRFVVAIEEHVVASKLVANTPLSTSDHESVKKPGGVSSVPFCRAGIGHRLDRLVGLTERRSCSLGASSYRSKTLSQGGDVWGHDVLS